MNRRTFVTSLASATILAAEPSPVIKPAVLKEGDTVGLITPSTYVSDPDALIAVQRTVDYFQLKAKYGPNVRKKFGYLGGTVQERVDDLHLMFRDPEVKAVIAIRMGRCPDSFINTSGPIFARPYVSVPEYSESTCGDNLRRLSCTLLVFSRIRDEGIIFGPQSQQDLNI